MLKGEMVSENDALRQQGKVLAEIGNYLSVVVAFASEVEIRYEVKVE